MYDLDGIRSDFPLLSSVIYLDSAATCQTTSFRANHGRGAYRIAREATRRYDEARETVAAFIGAAPGQLAFTRNSTDALNVVVQCMGLCDGDHAITNQLEHHSNLIPWLRLRDRGVEITVLPFDEGCRVTPESINDAVRPNTRVVTLTHLSNVSGTVQDVSGAARVAHDNGALMVVDGAQAVGHMPVDVGTLECDYYAFSGHKGPLGPVGTGALYVREPEKFEPVVVGGGTVHSVDSKYDFGFEPFPASAEAGTPNIAGAMGFARGVEYVLKLGLESIHGHEEALARHAAGSLEDVDGVTIYGPNDRTGMVCFNVGDLNCHDVSMILDETRNICTRSGLHCASLAVRAMGARDGTVRASFGCYTTREEVDALVAAVEEISATLA